METNGDILDREQGIIRPPSTYNTATLSDTMSGRADWGAFAVVVLARLVPTSQTTERMQAESGDVGIDGHAPEMGGSGYHLLPFQRRQTELGCVILSCSLGSKVVRRHASTSSR